MGICFLGVFTTTLRGNDGEIEYKKCIKLVEPYSVLLSHHQPFHLQHLQFKMIFSFELFFIITSGLLARYVISHPGEDHTAEIAQRSAYLQQAERRSLSHCADKLKARGLAQQSQLRRRGLAETLRGKQGIESGTYS